MNDATMVVVMMETVAALENVEEIAAVRWRRHDADRHQ